MKNISKKMMTLLVVLLVAGVVSAAEMVTLKLKKLDGTEVTKEVDKPQYGGSITDLMRAGEPSFDPLLFVAMAHTVPPMYDGQFDTNWYRGPAGTGEFPYNTTVTPPASLKGGVIETWEQPSLTKMIFHIRKGIHYWNKSDVLHPYDQVESAYGRELDAFDVEYSCNNMFVNDRSLLNGYGGAKCKATDKWTVEYTWDEPDGLGKMIRFYTFQHGVYPKETKGINLGDWQNALGSGPFIPTGFTPGSIATYKKNPNYWDHDPLHPENKLPYLDGMKMIVFSDWPTHIAALRAGKIDKIAPWYGVPPNYVAELSESNPELMHVPSTGDQRPIDVRLDVKPWDDIRIRKAAMLALDHQGIVDEFFEGSGELLTSYSFKASDPFHHSLEELPPDLQENYGYDPERAKKLLAEAGFPNGFDTSITCKADQCELIELYAAYLSAVGIRAEVKQMEAAEHNSMWNQYKWPELASQDTGNLGISEWMAFSGEIHPGQGHVRPIEDPEWKKMWQSYSTDTDRDSQLVKWKELNIYTLRKLWNIQTVAAVPHNYWQPWLRNYSGEQGVFETFWYINKFIWIDCDLKQESSGRDCND
jgi:peptide/nickel transport system substrate-binding protein